MPRPKWTDEQKAAARERNAAKKAQAGSGSESGSNSTSIPTSISISTSMSTSTSIPTTPAPSPSPIPAVHAPGVLLPAPVAFDRITRNGKTLATIPIKPLTEPVDTREVMPAVHERLSGLKHVNECISDPSDSRRIREIAYIRYQIACQIKTLTAIDEDLEVEGRELMIVHDVAEPMRFDFLKIKLGKGGGGERIQRKLLEAAGIPLDTISQCSTTVKSWERMQVEDGVEERKHSHEDGD